VNFDERQSAATVVVRACDPLVAGDGGDAAADVAAGSGLRRAGDPPGAAGVVEHEQFVVVRGRVDVAADGLSDSPTASTWPSETVTPVSMTFVVDLGGLTTDQFVPFQCSTRPWSGSPLHLAG
jgi:hypothetical protein